MTFYDGAYGDVITIDIDPYLTLSTYILANELIFQDLKFDGRCLITIPPNV